MFRQEIRLLLKQGLSPASVVDDGREGLLTFVASAIGQLYAAGAVTEHDRFHVIRNGDGGRVFRIQFGMDVPVVYLEIVSLPIDRRGFFVPVVHLHDEQEAVGTAILDSGAQVPLVRISRVGTVSGRYGELVGLRNLERLPAEQLPLRGEALRFVGSVQGKSILLYMEGRGTVQQPIPADGFGGFQLIVYYDDARVKHPHVAQVFGKRRGAESVGRRLRDTCLLKVVYPDLQVAGVGVGV